MSSPRVGFRVVLVATFDGTDRAAFARSLDDSIRYLSPWALRVTEPNGDVVIVDVIRPGYLEWLERHAYQVEFLVPYGW